MAISRIQTRLLADCADDDMGLWVVIWELTNTSLPKLTQDQVKRTTLEIVKEMLLKGWIVVGTPIEKDGETVFQLFPMSVDQAIAFIEEEWNKLGRLPNIGEVCWFRATPAGKQLMDELR